MARWRDRSIDAKAARGIAATSRRCRATAGKRAPACALVSSPTRRRTTAQDCRSGRSQAPRRGAARRRSRRAGLLGRRGILSSGGRPRSRPRNSRGRCRRGRVEPLVELLSTEGGGGGDGDPDANHEWRPVDRAGQRRCNALADGDDRANARRGALTALARQGAPRIPARAVAVLPRRDALLVSARSTVPWGLALSATSCGWSYLRHRPRRPAASG